MLVLPLMGPRGEPVVLPSQLRIAPKRLWERLAAAMGLRR
jgi:hypothetical protein